ncbi:hypothetical protein Dda_5337 [Drechslerella dactyloides]|uniref:Uncharacterized protein n=1 Tax=Drechslerella dactyloides TaxID=74499 RepID=A0AAD6IXC2_DREDA|nr:hypothetical protein Dda_5337 [Drechslerella dactyloides]
MAIETSSSGMPRPSPTPNAIFEVSDKLLPERAGTSVPDDVGRVGADVIGGPRDIWEDRAASALSAEDQIWMAEGSTPYINKLW